jgi:hypothetical protein
MVTARAAKEARRRAALKKSTPSSIDRLEPEVRELIHQLRVDKGFTIDEIRAAVVKIIGEERAPSRSALGRHVRTLAEISAEMREARVVSEVVFKEVGSKDEQELVQTNIQLLHLNMFKLMMAAKDGEGVVLGPQDTKFLSEVVRNTSNAQKTKQEVNAQVEKRAAEKERLKNAETAATAARAKGLSKDTVDAIRKAVLGSEA